MAMAVKNQRDRWKNPLDEGRLDRREKKLTEGGGEVLFYTSQGLVRTTEVLDQHALARDRLSHVLANTESVVRATIGSLKLRAPKDAEAFLPYYEHIKHEEHADGTFIDPGQEKDMLYQMDEDGVVRPKLRDPRRQRTRMWYGPIGSGDKLVKNARKCSGLRDKYNVIGLEMEAAGTMNRIPVGLIRVAFFPHKDHRNSY